MKKSLIILSILSLAALNVDAQSADQYYKTNNAVCKKPANMPKDAVMVFPKSAYTPLQDASCPPCYEYTTKRGLKVMECPYLWFPPENGKANGATTPAQARTAQVSNNSAATNMDVQSQNSYTGNYPVCEKLPGMPANATPVWPKSAYTPTGNPACPPCYEYTTKRGLKVMECPNLWFPPEEKE